MLLNIVFISSAVQRLLQRVKGIENANRLILA